MTRGAWAEQAGVSLQTVEELERGYPVPAEVAAAICRNLDLPEPDLESSPVIRLALLLKQRRGQARLSRAQVAQRAGLPAQVLRALETASQWPSQQVC
ncbi:MAG TPA: helix-turn-helix domain-containing protein, partial [Pseudomonadota bacterium]|nr:helix-turn-helix domain-containing protein [Pseudomonadota bacterium]